MQAFGGTYRLSKAEVEQLFWQFGDEDTGVLRPPDFRAFMAAFVQAVGIGEKLLVCALILGSSGELHLPPETIEIWHHAASQKYYSGREFTYDDCVEMCMHTGCAQSRVRGRVGFCTSR